MGTWFTERRQMGASRLACMYCSWILALQLTVPRSCQGRLDETVSCEDSSCWAPGQLNPEGMSEVEATVRLRCTMACLDDYDIALRRLNNHTNWPTLAFSDIQSDCSLHQKIQECRVGCTTAMKNPTLTSNKCRDECYSNCRDATCGGQVSCSQTGSSCERKCRRTYCRFGCLLRSDLSSQTNAIIANPVVPPTLTPAASTDNATRGAYFLVNLPGAMTLHPNSSISGQSPIVGFIIKVESQSQQSRYYWLENPEQPMDLSAFRCQHVSVSFAVVSKHDISSYSPSEQTCIHGFKGGKPSQVSETSLSVAYSEDMRPNYFGYSIANITWEKPDGFQYITSYTIEISAQTDECGGSNSIYRYTNIPKNSNSFILQANSHHGLVKFGCSYILTIRTWPADEDNLGTFMTLAPELPTTVLPITLACSKNMEDDGTYSISATWMLSNSGTMVLDAVKRFVIYSSLEYSTGWGIIQDFPYEIVQPQENRMDYTIKLSGFTPQSRSNLVYKIEVRTERKEQYFWRTVPGPQRCSVDAIGPSPSPVTDIRVQSYSGDADNRINFTAMWDPPVQSNGVIVQYEFRVGTEPIAAKTEQVSILSGRRDNTTTSIFWALDLNDTTHCLYLQVRAFNQYQPSNWTSVIIPASSCDESEGRYHQPSSDSRISVYREDGNVTTKLAEINCNNIQINSTAIERLQVLDEKLAAISANTETWTSIEELSTRLTRIESKLDVIISFLSSSSP